MIHVKVKDVTVLCGQIPSSCTTFRYRRYGNSKWMHEVEVHFDRSLFAAFVENQDDNSCGISLMSLEAINELDPVWEPCDIEIKVGKVGE